MSDRLSNIRAARNAAHSALVGHANKVKQGLAEKSIASRIADDVKATSEATARAAIDVAKESKGIIAGTGAVLTLWFLRAPLLEWIEAQWTHISGNEEESGQ